MIVWVRVVMIRTVVGSGDCCSTTWAKAIMKVKATFTVLIQMMTSAQVVEMLVNNSPFWDYTHPDDQTTLPHVALGFKPFTVKVIIRIKLPACFPSIFLAFPQLTNKFGNLVILTGASCPLECSFSQHFVHFVAVSGHWI